jgi:hypothetical protein
MRYLKIIFVWLALLGGLAGSAFAAAVPEMLFEFDGGSVKGRAMPSKEISVRLMIQVTGGGYTNVAWSRFSQATIQRLSNLPGYSVYATPFLDVPPQNPPEGPKIVIKSVKRMDRPAGAGLFASPGMWMIFFLLYAANIYAGYEIAIYRHRNPLLLASLSAIGPIIVPVIYVSLPSAVTEEAVEEAPAEAVEGEAAPAEAAPAEAAPAAEAEAAPAQPQFQTTSYMRGQTTFNRRFFETKLAGYLKVVPGEAEKDMVLAITATRGSYVGKRLVRVSPNELTLLVVKGEASQEVMIPFSEISEVRIQHKDAPA